MGGFPSRCPSRTTDKQHRRRIHPIHRRNLRTAPPDHPQHPQREDLARPAHHRQARKSPQNPTMGNRTPKQKIPNTSRRLILCGLTVPNAPGWKPRHLPQPPAAEPRKVPKRDHFQIFRDGNLGTFRKRLWTIRRLRDLKPGEGSVPIRIRFNDDG